VSAIFDFDRVTLGCYGLGVSFECIQVRSKYPPRPSYVIISVAVWGRGALFEKRSFTIEIKEDTSWI